MSGEALPDEAHVVRYLSPLHVRDGSGQGTGFCLRSADDGAFSVDWLECLAASGADPLSEARRVSQLRLKPKGRFAVLRVGDVLRAVTSALTLLASTHEPPRVTHDPLPEEGCYPANPAHSLLWGLPPPDTVEASAVGDVIAKQVKELHPAVVESE